ncbi:Ionotropic receptor 227, partial [Frankliniella occidentalis]
MKLVERVVLLGALVAGAAALARTALPVVSLRGSPGSESIVNILSTFLLHATGARPGIVVLGDNNHIGAILRQLPSETPMSVVFNDSLIDIRQDYHFHRTNNIFLVVRDSGLDDLLNFGHVPFRSRLLIWAHAQTSRDEFTIPNRRRMWVYRPREVAFALTSYDNNSTTLYTPTPVSEGDISTHYVTAKKINRWVPEDQRWESEEIVFSKSCSRWQAHHKNSSLTVRALTPSKGPARKTFKRIVNMMTRALGEMVVDVVWMTEESGKKMNSRRAATEQCTLDAFIMYRPFDVFMAPHVRFETHVFSHVVVVVPADAGLLLSPLQAVKNEFSVELWIAMALTVPCVVVATVVTAVARSERPSPVAAFMQTLAPLVAQPLPSEPAHRILLGSWLLMCVVLTAAYQGLLLRELTAPPPQIKNLDQLERSGLAIKVDRDMYQDASQFLPETLLSRATFVNLKNFEMSLQKLAHQRNSGIILSNDVYTSAVLLPWFKRSRKPQLHMFALTHERVKSHTEFSTGSPLELPMQKIIRRMEDAGIASFRKLPTEKNVANAPEHQARPLRFSELRPAFVLWYIGHCTGGLLFALEVLYDKYICKTVDY